MITWYFCVFGCQTSAIICVHVYETSFLPELAAWQVIHKSCFNRLCAARRSLNMSPMRARSPATPSRRRTPPRPRTTPPGQGPAINERLQTSLAFSPLQPRRFEHDKTAAPVEPPPPPAIFGRTNYALRSPPRARSPPRGILKNAEPFQTSALPPHNLENR